MRTKASHHKNLLPVTYVAADIAGQIESPVYAVLQLGPEIDKIKIPEGYQIEQHMAAVRRCRALPRLDEGNGTANGTSPMKSFATSVLRSRPC